MPRFAKLLIQGGLVEITGGCTCVIYFEPQRFMPHSFALSLPDTFLSANLSIETQTSQAYWQEKIAL